MNDAFWQSIEQTLSQLTGRPQSIQQRQDVGGGCINQAFCISTGRDQWFIKVNSAHLESMFEAESTALSEIYATRTIKAPQPIAHGISGSHSFLILEYLDTGQSPNPQQFGQHLAAMHAIEQDYFGWHQDNTIGSTPQINDRDSNWIRFFRDKRLGYQNRLARKNGSPSTLISLVESLQEELDSFFTNYSPTPSLLHGDLWSGNWGADSQGTPIIFDPASYYGDREADLAMMELFGHPGMGFFDAYNEALPTDPGYSTRKVLYNLYHILNHFNLFGGGYAAQAERMCQQLLSETR